MQTLKVKIFSDGSVGLEMDSKDIMSQSDVEEITTEILNQKIETQVFYNQQLVTLYPVQGGIGAKGIGYIAPLLGNPLANLFLALCEEWLMITISQWGCGVANLRPQNYFFHKNSLRKSVFRDIVTNGLF